MFNVIFDGHDESLSCFEMKTNKTFFEETLEMVLSLDAIWFQQQKGDQIV